MPLDPFIKKAIQRAYRGGHDRIAALPVELARERYRIRAAPTIPGIVYRDEKVEHTQLRFHDARDPTVTTLTPVILYFRPSGFVFGEIADSDAFCHLLAQALKMLVIAVEPRLAPEHRFPIPFQDALVGTEYIYKHCEILNVDPRRVILWGESSGGSLVAAIAQELSNYSDRQIWQQILFYPPLVGYTPREFATLPSVSIEAYSEGYMLDKALYHWFMEQYIDIAEAMWDPRCSPLYGKKSSRHPATFFIGAQYDPVRDESFDYLAQLTRAGVLVEAHYFLGMPHGFLWYRDKLDVAKIAQNMAAEYVKKCVAEA